jgi:hypothetical protein
MLSYKDILPMSLYCAGFKVLIEVNMMSAFFLPVIIFIPSSNLNSQMTFTNLLIFHFKIKL